jgi:D-alanyl-D-alanine carboxypeptidase/D-alanyl-D-alanine-endopeptidase (penicillin-binding protein 4)
VAWIARLIPIVLGLACVAAAPAAAAASARATAAALDGEMRLAGKASGALVIDLDSGEELYSLRADGKRVPASVEKLYTTSTALLRFGDDGRLATRALAGQPPDEAGVLDGDLYLHGGGDPTFDAADATRLAGRLADTGLKRVTGAVVGDESAFDDRRGPPSSSFRTSSYVGPLSALSFNRGRTGLRAPWFQSDPATFAAEAFERALRREGVKIGDSARDGAAPATAVALAELPSPAMADLARLTNVPSDNYLAEILVKALGMQFAQAGSTAAGTKVVRTTLAPMGLRPRVVDGSGLSRANRTSPRQVVGLLQHMSRDETVQAAAFRDSLAIAGRSGTLRRRMRGTAAAGRCRAKTGTLNSVSALAGYCDTTRGGHVAFAFLMNRVGAAGARQIQDRMTVELARYSP